MAAMLKPWVRFVFGVVLCLEALPSTPQPFSAVRQPGESYQKALMRSHDRALEVPALTAEVPPVLVANPIEKAEAFMAPVMTKAQATAIFKQVRDERFLALRSYEDPASVFDRRLSWLYPKDGCYARAELAIRRSAMKGKGRPAKIFAFGSLSLKTPYAKSGKVTWWYHVSPVVKVSDTELWVLDPSVESSRPLTVKEWASRMGDTNHIRVAVCSPFTYGPTDPCAGSLDEGVERALKDEGKYLDLEWRNLKSLSKNPTLTLGDAPPWATELASSH